MDRRPVRRLEPDRSAPPPPPGPGATVLVGENGSGKSTVLEVLAAAIGINAEGGSRNTRLVTRPSEPGSLALVVERSPGADRWAYFLRDE